MGLGDWLKKLFGGTAIEAHNNATNQAYSAAQRAQIRNNAVQIGDDVEGAEHIHVHGTGENARLIRRSGEADLVEEDGETQWVDRVNGFVPREQWVDVWGPLQGHPSPLEEFCYHEHTFDRTRNTDPNAAEQKLLAFGYQNVGHFYYVRNTIIKYYARPTGPLLANGLADTQEYTNAFMRATQRYETENAAAFLNANQQLLAPIEGVTFELYTQISAKQGAQASQAEITAILAQHGIDFPTFLRASEGWVKRMQSDGTGTLARKYGELFMAQGQGAYGAAGAAGAAASFSGGVTPGGNAPMPFETFCELSGAMSAWATSGQDVNALMKQRFGVTASDYGNISTWWMATMSADLPMFDQYNAKLDYYTQQYQSAIPNASSGIQF
jgi:hypothetical protein